MVFFVPLAPSLPTFLPPFLPPSLPSDLPSLPPSLPFAPLFCFCPRSESEVYSNHVEQTVHPNKMGDITEAHVLREMAVTARKIQVRVTPLARPGRHLILTRDVLATRRAWLRKHNPAPCYQDLSAAKGYLTRALWSLASAASLSPLWSPLWLRLHIESGEVLLALGDIKTALWHFSQHLAGLVARPIPPADATAGGRGRQGPWFKFHRELCTGCLYLGATLQSIMAHDLAAAFLMRSAGACRALAEGYVEDIAPYRPLTASAVPESIGANAASRPQGECDGLLALGQQRGEACGGALSLRPEGSAPLAKIRIRLEPCPGDAGREVVKVDIILDGRACNARLNRGALTFVSGNPSDNREAVGAPGSEGSGPLLAKPPLSHAGPVPHLSAIADLERSIDEVPKGLRKEEGRIRAWLSCAVADLERLRRPVLPSLPTTPVGAAGDSKNILLFKDEQGDISGDGGDGEGKTSGAAVVEEERLCEAEDEDEDWDKELEIEEKVNDSNVGTGMHSSEHEFLVDTRESHNT